ncbi:MAG: isoprenyl transferase [Chloroflexi bacterium]|nr:isoprenyl transferase [Chloroflexota bacterium]
MSAIVADQLAGSALAVVASEKMPRHIAIIMDGNGRWARSRRLPRTFGHRAGVETLHRIVEECGRLDIPMLTVYAFSTENWTRPQTEVSFLMRLLAESFGRYLDRLITEGVRIRHLGRCDRLPQDLLERIREAERVTARNSKLQLNVALDYGSRSELTEAIRAMARDGVDLRSVTEEQVSAYLYTRGLPDPDLIIRTGGEVRLSNFLLWQAAYAEYYATQKFWPDFGAADLHQALQVFATRQRRYGGVISAE